MRSLAKTWDAVVVGSGPNGLTAAVTLARAGQTVLVIEGRQEIGGGARTLELTLPGFLHDVCSAIHPLAVTSPALRRMPLDRHGLAWVHPAAPLAHPLEGGRAVLLERSVAATAERLGRDAAAYFDLFAPVVDDWERLVPLVLGRMRWPKHPAAAGRFAVSALRSAQGLLDAKFRSTAARALLAGIAGHSGLRLEEAPSAAFALTLGGAGHAVGWPFPRSGAGNITRALASYLGALGGRIETGSPVNSIDELPPCRCVLLDVSARELLRIAGARFPAWYRRTLQRFRYGPGAFKVDWALDGPIPWRAPECRRAGTIHLGGTAEEIAASERQVCAGRAPDYPFVLAAQHTLFDSSRAPDGKHTAWAYCHAPNGSNEDMTNRIERQVERFAPGFSSRVLARSVLGPAALEAHNPNLVGGDVSGGANHLAQVFARPSLCLHHTPDERILLCSSATPPGAGVHGMCGHFAARLALRRLRRGYR
ncbi:MAG: NAD(P)/FAD-dependent oxidoreductase [Bryobacteraceae bacterium]|nr:NAD(P)/FAD-dependent oxidoreductase [Bryobacteraceae bacterium]